MGKMHASNGDKHAPFFADTHKKGDFPKTRLTDTYFNIYGLPRPSILERKTSCRVHCAKSTHYNSAQNCFIDEKLKDW